MCEGECFLLEGRGGLVLQGCYPGTLYTWVGIALNDFDV